MSKDLTPKQLEQFNNTFNEIVTAPRFTIDRVQIVAGLDQETLASEEFAWYSTINTAIGDNEPLTFDEKLAFLSMHRAFLQLTI